MSRNYGDQFVDSVRQYMQANEIKTLGGINGTLLADLAQRFHEKFTGAQKTRRKQLCEEEWVQGLEKDPTFDGIDIRRELGKCQFWCKERNLVATRKRFSNWLLKAEKTIGVYQGASSRPRPTEAKPTYTLDTPVPSWPMLIRSYVCADLPETEIDQLCSGDWADLPVSVREKIIRYQHA